jgi:hypothetical protein
LPFECNPQRYAEAIEIGLPDLDARERLVQLYFDKLIAKGKDAVGLCTLNQVDP